MADDEEVREVFPADVDPVLVMLVNAMLRSDVPEAGIGVTLMVGGSLVTGTIISPAVWMDLLQAQIPTDDPETGLAAVFGQVATIYRDKWREAREADDGTDPVYVHLRDAAVYVSNRLVPANKDMLWRGRLSEVSGWNFGSLVGAD